MNKQDAAVRHVATAGPYRKTRNRAPLYAVLAQRLTDAIAHGDYPIGSLLPTELELSESFGMSRQTVREALRQMTAIGLVVRQPGVGTRVQRAHAPIRYIHSVDSFHDLEDYAKSLHLKIEFTKMVEVSGELAEFVGCRESSRWLYIRGVRMLEGSDQAVAFSETYLKPDFPNIRKHLANLSGTALHVMLEREYGEVIQEIRQRIVSIALSEEVAHVLNAKPGSPGLEIRRRFYGPGNRLVISGHVIHAGSQFSYESRFIREALQEP